MDQQTAYRNQAGAYRANHRRAMEIGFHSAGVKLPHVPQPAGFNFPAADPLTTLGARRQSLLAAQRADRAEMVRRDIERAEYSELGIDAPHYILTDGLIRQRMACRIEAHMRYHRGEFMPLATLAGRESDLRVVEAFRQWAIAA